MALVMGLLWAAIAILVIVAIIAGVKSCMFIVQQNTVAVIKRFGRHHIVLPAGPHFRIPLVDTCYRTHSGQRRTIDLVVRGDAGGGMPVDLVVELEVRADISDLALVAELTYQVEQPLAHLQTVATQTVRQHILPLTFAEVLAQSVDETLAAKLQNALAADAASCGFIIIAVRITSVLPDRTVREAILATARGDEERKNEAAQADQDNVLRTQRATSIAEAAAIEAAAKNDQLRTQIDQIVTTINRLTADGRMSVGSAGSIVNTMLHQQTLLTAVGNGGHVNVLPADINAGGLAQSQPYSPLIPGTPVPGER